MIVIKNWIIILYNGISWDLIGLAAILYEPLYHAKEIETIKLSPGCSSKAKSARSSNIYFFFNKTIIPLALVGYQTIIANAL